MKCPHCNKLIETELEKFTRLYEEKGLTDSGKDKLIELMMEESRLSYKTECGGKDGQKN